MKKLIAILSAAVLASALMVAPAFAAQSPNAQNGATVNTANATDGTTGATTTSAPNPKSPKTGVDLGSTATMTASLIFGAGVATVLLRRKLTE